MKTKWTEAQQKVIEHREGNLLVAAAAGSGKTAVLVEHVIGRITDPVNPVSLQDLVVMTFTNAAAQEMKERIRQAMERALRKNPTDANLLRESGSIQNAYISTIDSFCKQLITENYAAIGLDPGFRLADQGELQLLKGDIIRDLLEERYAEGDETFLKFMDRFAKKNKADGTVPELIQRLHTNAEARPWPEEYLDHLAAEAAAQSPKWKKQYIHMLKDRIENVYQRLCYALRICQEPDGPESHIPMLEGEIQSFSQLLNLLEEVTFEELAERAGRVQFVARAKPSKSPRKDRVKAIRDEAKALVKEIIQFCTPLPEELENRMREGTREQLLILITLTKEFMKRFQEEKEQRHMLDFSDLEHKALEMLYTGSGEERHFSALADDYAHRFKEILVDEYQDSNYLQEELIRALSAERFGRPDVFQVGDVKQSIYGFRQARPDLFLGKYDDPEYPTIELSQNFRSRYEVLHATNDVCFRVMQKSVGGIHYTEEAALHPGRADAIAMKESVNEDGAILPHFMLVENDKDLAKELLDGQTISKEELESYMIAQKIRKLHEQGIAYRDIVILMRAPGGWGDNCVDILEKEGVPAYCTHDKGYFTTTEVETVLSLLQVIDNPEQDIPLAAVMHSPMYDFTDEELAEIVAVNGSLRCPAPPEEIPMTDSEERSEAAGEPLIEDDYQMNVPAKNNSSETRKLSPELEEKLTAFYASIAKFRLYSQYLSIHELLYRVFDETGYYQYASAMPAGKRRKANLDALIDSALNFEKTSYKGLFDYVRYIEKLRSYESDEGEASVYSDQDDLVRIMSMHKSKGLQFKVVFLAGLGKKFNKTDLTKELLVDDELGLGCDYQDPERKIKVKSMQREVIKEKQNLSQLGEELRILYVAMTRAEEQLYLTAVVDSIDKKLGKYPDASEPLSAVDIAKAQGFSDWILMAEGAEKLMRTGSSHGPIILDTLTLEDIFHGREEEIRKELALEEKLYDDMAKVDVSGEAYRDAAAHLASVYGHLDAVKLRPKHSVSEIKESEIEKFEANEVSGHPERWMIHADVDQPVSPEAPEKKTVALGQKEQGGAAVGDAYHHAFERYDYEKGIEQLSEILDEEEYARIRPERFEQFLNTSLAEKFREAQKNGTLFREQHFMKQVRDCDLFPEHTSEEPVLLQGIIDAFILEDDGIILVDYKSDHVREEGVLIGRYKAQLDLYAMALREIIGRPVKEKWIYSIHLGKAIAV